MKKKVYLFGFFLTLLLFIPKSVFSEDNKSSEKVSLLLRYYHQFQFAGYYAAKEMGYYKTAGLDVTIVEGSPNTHRIYPILTGKYTYGVSSSDVVSAKMNNEPIRLLAVIFQHSPMSLMTLKSEGIRSPSDLVGKRVIVGNDYENAEILAMFMKEGISLESIISVKDTWNVNDLLDKSVDAVLAYETNEPFYFAENSVETFLLRPIDYGIDFYGDVLFTSDTEIQEHPERAASFKAASLKGWKYAMSNIDEMIDIIISYEGVKERGITKEKLRLEAEAMQRFVLPDIVEIGHINIGRLEKIGKIYSELGIHKGDYSLDNFVFNPEEKEKFDFTVLIIIGSVFLGLLVVSFGFVFQLKRMVKLRTEELTKEVSERARQVEMQKELEEEIRKNDMSKEALLNAIPDLMFRLNKEGVYLDYRAPFDSDLQIPANKVIGKTITELLPKEVCSLAFKAINKTLETSTAQIVEYKMPHKDELKSFEARITPSGKDEVLVIVRDITEVRTKQEELKKSEDKFFKIFNSSPEAILITKEKDNTIVNINEGFTQLSGYSEEDIIGKSTKEVNLWHQLDDRSKFFEEFRISGRIKNYDSHFLTKDGKIRNGLISAERIVLDGDNFILSIIQDITERKQTEEKFSTIFKSSPNPIVITDLETGEIMEVNENFKRDTGYNISEVIGKSVLEIKLWESNEKRKQYVEKLITSNRIKEYQADLRKKSGELFPALISAEIIMLDNRKCIIANFENISDLKEKEAKLTQALNELSEIEKRTKAENVYLKEEIKFEHNFDGIITRNEKYKDILRSIEQVASTDATVLILGETGTGKELLARSIHNISDRADKPLVKVNCAALPESLIESELFGHEKGAFTGATDKKIGRFELANNGTLFLDEIGELPFDLQAKLLRVLQEGEIERLGSSKSISVDVRVIAATNRDLKKLSVDGKFRQDLYFRLNVFPIETIPLRERKEDIVLLLNHFVKVISQKIGREISSIPQSSINVLMEYDWPGNVREFENIIERAIITSQNSELNLEKFITIESKTMKSTNSLTETLSDIEKKLILETLEKCDWKIEGKDGAAKEIGMAPSTLRDKIKRYQINKPN